MSVVYELDVESFRGTLQWSVQRQQGCTVARGAIEKVCVICQGPTKTDGPAWLQRRHERKAPRERGRPARTTLAQPRPSPPPGSTGNGARTLHRPAPWGSRRQGCWMPHRSETERHATGVHAGGTPALPEGRLLPSFLLGEEALPLPMRQCRPASRAFVFLRVSSWNPLFSACFRQAPPLPCRADHTRVKHPSVNKDEPRMNTNRHEDRWTCLAATTSREEGRERGRPARTTLAQPRPSPPPGSTGNGARTLHRPAPWGSRRQGGRLPHYGETERLPNAENAGETPALPGGVLPPNFAKGSTRLFSDQDTGHIRGE